MTINDFCLKLDLLVTYASQGDLQAATRVKHELSKEYAEKFEDVQLWRQVSNSIGG